MTAPKKITHSWFFISITALFLIYTLLPLIATLFFSLAQKWSTTILPEVWSAKAYVDLIQDPAFFKALFRSIVLSSVVTVIELVITVLALLGAAIGRGRLGDTLELLSIIPVALPSVVLALGTVRFYGIVMPILLGQPILLIGVQVAFGLPFVFWTLQNAFRTLNIRHLYEASCTLQGSAFQFIVRVLLPSLRRGLTVAGVIAFASAIDNFALQQLIVGASWETYPILQNKYFRIDGHITSALSMIAILITFTLTAAAGYFNRPMSEIRKENKS